MSETPGRVVGIGGVFFKSANKNELRAWYVQHLSVKDMFPWRSAEAEGREHLTVWSVFPQSSTYFDPSKSQFMINYIVDDLDALLSKLQASGVSIDPKRDNSEYGRFAWIYDPDGNKVELWEPPAAN